MVLIKGDIFGSRRRGALRGKEITFQSPQKDPNPPRCFYIYLTSNNELLGNLGVVTEGMDKTMDSSA